MSEATPAPADGAIYIEYPFTVVDAAVYYHFITGQEQDSDFHIRREMLTTGSVRYVESISGLNDVGYIELRSISTTATRLSYHADTDLSEGFQGTLNGLFALRLNYLAFLIGAELIDIQYFVHPSVLELQGHRREVADTPKVIESLASQQREQERRVIEQAPRPRGRPTDAGPYYDHAFVKWQRTSSSGRKETIYGEYLVARGFDPQNTDHWKAERDKFMNAMKYREKKAKND